MARLICSDSVLRSGLAYFAYSLCFPTICLRLSPISISPNYWHFMSLFSFHHHDMVVLPHIPSHIISSPHLIYLHLHPSVSDSDPNPRTLTTSLPHTNMKIKSNQTQMNERTANRPVTSERTQGRNPTHAHSQVVRRGSRGLTN